MRREGVFVAWIVLAVTGCVGIAGGDRAYKTFPRPAKDTIIAVNQALRDLNFFPADIVPTRPAPAPSYTTTAYREESLGEIIYVTVRDLGAGRSQVEVLTRGDVTGTWTWSVWWPSLIFDQTARRLHSPHAVDLPPPLLPSPATPRATF